jgi:hypothetical protein
VFPARSRRRLRPLRASSRRQRLRDEPGAPARAPRVGRSSTRSSPAESAASRRVPRAPGEQRQTLLQPSEQSLRRQHLDACRGQLDRQRQPVEAAADVGHGTIGGEARPDGPCTLAEESHGIVLGQGRHRILLLDREAQRLTAGGQQLELGRGGDELGQAGRAAEHLLDVVEQEKRPTVAQVPAQVISSADGLGDSGLDQLWIADLLERYPPDVLEVVRNLGRELKGEARLPGPGWADERQQALLAQQLDRLGQLPLPADKRRRLHRQVRPVQRLQRRELLGAELEEPLRLEEILEAVLA